MHGCINETTPGRVYVNREHGGFCHACRWSVRCISVTSRGQIRQPRGLRIHPSTRPCQHYRCANAAEYAPTIHLRCLQLWLGNYEPSPDVVREPPTDEPRCTPLEMAQWDQYVWDQMVAGRNERLGERSIGAPISRTGCITRTANTVEVMVTWEGVGSVSGNANSSPTMTCGDPSEKRRSVLLVTTMTVTP